MWFPNGSLKLGSEGPSATCNTAMAYDAPCRSYETYRDSPTNVAQQWLNTILLRLWVRFAALRKEAKVDPLRVTPRGSETSTETTPSSYWILRKEPELVVQVVKLCFPSLASPRIPVVRHTQQRVRARAFTFMPLLASAVCRYCKGVSDGRMYWLPTIHNIYSQ